MGRTRPSAGEARALHFSSRGRCIFLLKIYCEHIFGIERRRLEVASALYCNYGSVAGQFLATFLERNQRDVCIIKGVIQFLDK